MQDDQALFLARLARSVGRVDFWNLGEELTPYQLAVWRAIEQVEPWGDERADLRAARNTTCLVSAMALESMSEQDLARTQRYLAYYLKVHQEDTPTMTPAQARMIMGD